jgi:hypothetical protein
MLYHRSNRQLAVGCDFHAMNNKSELGDNHEVKTCRGLRHPGAAIAAGFGAPIFPDFILSFNRSQHHYNMIQ